MIDNTPIDQSTYDLIDRVYGEGIKQAIRDYKESIPESLRSIYCPYSDNHLKLWWLRGYESQVKTNEISNRLFGESKNVDRNDWSSDIL